jgi:hypothetical protein
MIEIFYKSKGQIATSTDTKSLDDLGFDDVIWIDMFEPSRGGLPGDNSAEPRASRGD